jgi:dTDP-4-amino-4,6-dideoxygalactose transaminase
MKPILLSIPHMSGREQQYITQALKTNWVAPLGPNVDAFEQEMANMVGCKNALALSSGTAALHLALCVLGIGQGDIVFCSALTFVASANPIIYQNATPVFIDSEPKSWNMCPQALTLALNDANQKGKLPKAVIVANLYGQSANYEAICAVCDEYEVPIIEDAAESLGASFAGKPSGRFGLLGVFSFNGNKIITTSGGGMLVSDDKDLIENAHFLSTQAKLNKPYYLHDTIGYNYRLSNLLAGVGRAQLGVLDDRVKSRITVFEKYQRDLQAIKAIEWMPQLENAISTRWLSTMTLNPRLTKHKPQQLIDFLARYHIEARRVWNPMQRQPLFSGCDYYEHAEYSVSDYLFDYGVCLPSSSSLTMQEQDYVIENINEFMGKE